MAAIVTVTLNPALDLGFEVERVVPERKLRGSSAVFHPGGGGINVARAAGRLGADVRAIWIGGGCDGDKLAALLDDEHVPHERVGARAAPRMSVHVEERATGELYRFVLPGEELSAAEADAVIAAVAAVAGASYLVISGSQPPGLPAEFCARLAAGAPAETRVILDTSGEPLARGLAGRVYLAKPNRNELARLVGRELADRDGLIAAARELIDAGRVEVLAVSQAADGLTLVTRDGHEHIAAPPVTPVSTVGAGDSTVAGIVVGLARGLALPDAVRLGVAAGTAAVLTPGTELMHREDTERLYAQMAR
jgi:6-phosphofructokinase 2